MPGPPRTWQSNLRLCSDPFAEAEISSATIPRGRRLDPCAPWGFLAANPWGSTRSTRIGHRYRGALPSPCLIEIGVGVFASEAASRAILVEEVLIAVGRGEAGRKEACNQRDCEDLGGFHGPSVHEAAAPPLGEWAAASEVPLGLEAELPADGAYEVCLELRAREVLVNRVAHF